MGGLWKFPFVRLSSIQDGGVSVLDKWLKGGGRSGRGPGSAGSSPVSHRVRKKQKEIKNKASGRRTDGRTDRQTTEQEPKPAAM